MRILLLLQLIFSFFISSLFAQDETENNLSEMKLSFKNPPLESYAMTWWHWMNGNISKTGIQNDLAAMKNAGIQGAILFNVGLLPQGEVEFMSQNWWDHLSYAMQQADSLEMKFGIFNSDGWSMSGGPWITPEESMKKLVWADTLIEGGQLMKIQLPQPEFNAIYQDIVVLAIPALAQEVAWPVSQVSGMAAVKNKLALTDDKPGTLAEFHCSENDSSSVILDFGQPRTLRKVIFENVKANNFLDASVRLAYSMDGNNFTIIDGYLPLNLKVEGDVKTFTFSIPEITPRYIKVMVDFEKSSELTPTPMQQEFIGIGSIQCYAAPGVGLWEPKSGQSKRIRHDRQILNQQELNSITQSRLPDEWLVSAEKIIQLRDRLGPNGQLEWEVPAGDWKILRLGYTSTLRKNSPSTEAGRGLECDKMNAAAAKKHFNGYVAKVNQLSKKVVGKPLDYMQMESWEAGIQNWTAGFEEEFEKRNGYSIIPWLPVMAGGMVVNSYDESNRFLRDLRNTIADMMSENYWEVMHRLAAKNGIEVLGEGSGMQHYLYDPILYHQHNDVPMGEFWSNEGTPRADCKNAASVANTLGKKVVAAEAFTGAGSPGKELWRLTPYDLKKIGDEAFTLGVNQFVLHTFVHQPFEVGPGFTLARFGNHFQRHNTWYNQAQGWFDYLARSQYLLQKGNTVTDVCYFTGEGIPGYLGLRDELQPPLPAGFDYDGVNLEMIKTMQVEDGQLLLPSGLKYKLLVMQRVERMTPELASEIKRLVENGALVVSQKPNSSPSLTNYPTSDVQVQKIADEVWGDWSAAGKQENRYGKGKVVWGESIGELLQEMNCLPDFAIEQDKNGQLVKYIHKALPGQDIYFLANVKKEALKVDCSFRVENKTPEIWYPDGGKMEKVNFNQKDGIIHIPLEFDPLGSFFVVFSENFSAHETVQKELISEAKITGPWKVQFQSSNLSDQVVFDSLINWIDHPSPEIRYFSGTAIYANHFTINKEENQEVLLDLGKVKNLATVFINGKKVANLWKPPFKAEVSDFVTDGNNRLEIQVTNTAINRLVGDEQFPLDAEYKWGGEALEKFPEWIKNSNQRPSSRTTFVTHRIYDQDSELESSGLLGPVVVKVRK